MPNVLYVCAHYSERYEGSDGYLTQHGNHGDDLSEYALFLRDNTLSEIVQGFASSELQTCADSNITSKDMKFLWKRYLDRAQIPYIASYDTWHTELKQLTHYELDNDVYIGLTSPHLPLVSSFCEFWDKYVIKDDDSELEIGDIVMLFSGVGGKVGRSVSDPAAVLMDLIRHFYPSIVFEDDKYALGVKCTLWDKVGDVTNAIERFKKFQTDQEYSTSIDAIYEHYSKVPKTMVVSKRFFEKVATDILTDHLDECGCVTSTLWA
jgi:hypothetical protein